MSNHTFESWISKQEHIVVYFIIEGLFVYVVLTVLCVAWLLEREALHTHVISVNDNALVKGLLR